MALEEGGKEDLATAGKTPVLFVLEALLIYLEADAARALLAACAAEARAAGAGECAAIAFADRLPGVEGCDAAAAEVLRLAPLPTPCHTPTQPTAQPTPYHNPNLPPTITPTEHPH